MEILDGVCTDEITITIGEPDEVVLTATATEVTCFGDADAIITASATGGASITVDGVAYDAATTYGPGTYVVLASAAGGNTGDVCTDEITITIGEPDEVVLTATATEVTCFGDADAIITASATGGASITVDGVAYDAATTYGPGTYVVLASAANGNNDGVCTDEITITIGEPDEVVLTATATEVTCFGDADAIITASATGGASITVDGVAYDAATTYGPGTYVVLASAAGGNTGDVCTDEITITIGEPDEVVLTATATEVTCFGDADAIITASATGGASITVDGVAYDAATTYGPGTYVVLASAAGGNTGDVCTDEITITIGEPDDLTALITFQQNVLCFGDATGLANVSVEGGTEDYTYSWNTTPEQTGATAVGLTAGSYTVIITDANGCMTAAGVLITQPDAALTAAITSQEDVLCFADATGSATVTVEGGIEDYTYSWNTTPEQTGVTAIGLTAGTYIVTVTDANECTTTAEVIITQPDAALTAAITSQEDVLCFADATGSATVTVEGGTEDYTYSWNTTPEQTGATAVGLTAGTYIVTVTDANGCMTTAEVIITQPDAALTAAITSQEDVLCFADATGSATVTVEGGTEDYTYSWNTIPEQTECYCNWINCRNLYSNSNGC